MKSTIPLHMLKKNTVGRISSIQCDESHKKRLYALGVHEDLSVRIIHEGPVGADPIAIELDGHTVAMRRRDAANIHVYLEETLDDAA